MPWTFLVAQMVMRLPTMRETRVRSLGWEDPLEEMATRKFATIGSAFMMKGTFGKKKEWVF